MADAEEGAEAAHQGANMAGVNQQPDPMNQCVVRIGFYRESATRIAEEIGSPADLASLKHSDASALSKSFASRTQAEGRIYFGVDRLEKFKALSDWAEDFTRIGEVPEIRGVKQTKLQNQPKFLHELETSAQRAETGETERVSTCSGAKESAQKNDWGEECLRISKASAICSADQAEFLQDLGTSAQRAEICENERVARCIQAKESAQNKTFSEEEIGEVHCVGGVHHAESVTNLGTPSPRAAIWVKEQKSWGSKTGRRKNSSVDRQNTIKTPTHRREVFQTIGTDRINRSVSLSNPATSKQNINILLKEMRHDRAKQSDDKTSANDGDKSGLKFEFQNQLSKLLATRSLPATYTTRERVAEAEVNLSNEFQIQQLMEGHIGKLPIKNCTPCTEGSEMGLLSGTQTARIAVQQVVASSAQTAPQISMTQCQIPMTQCLNLMMRRPIPMTWCGHDARATTTENDWKTNFDEVAIIPITTGTPRQIGKFSSSLRRVSRMASSAVPLHNMVPEEPVFGKLELDSHADTCVFGLNFLLLSYTGRECDVSPYSDSYEAVQNVPIVSAATAWTCQDSGETFILIFHEGLWMPSAMSHSLVNPNQLRAFGLFIQDDPYSGAPLYMEAADGDLTIPLDTSGTVIHTTTRTPTQHELDSCRHIQMTSEWEWNPSRVHFPAARWSIIEDQARRISALGITLGLQDGTSDGTTLGNELGIDAFNARLIATTRQTFNTPTILEDVPAPNTFASSTRRSSITPQELADRWCIGLEQATLTLKNTTQNIVRSALLPLARRYKADRIFQLPRLQGEWFTDTVDGRVKSKDGNRYAQIFANDTYFAAIYPMDSKSKAGDALRVFCQEFGAPERLIHDGSREQMGKRTEFQRQVRRHNISTRVIEPEMHNQNPGEGVVREVRRKWYRIMFKKRVPRVFWDYGMRWTCDILQRTHLRGHRIDGGVPLQKLTGETVDISEYLDVGFYDKIWYRNNAGLGEQLPGRYLGVAKHRGGQMCAHVLTQQGTVVDRSTYWLVKNLELELDAVKQIWVKFDEAIAQMCKDEAFPIEGDKPDPEAWADLIEEDEEFKKEFFCVYGNDNAIETSQEPSPEIADLEYLGKEVALPRDGDGPELARVKKRMKDGDGKPIGVANDNPILDTRMFEVEFLDGYKSAMSANAIAENLFAQVDPDGTRQLILDEIIDSRATKDAVKKCDQSIKTAGNRGQLLPTTKGWELLIRWKDGSETWSPLKDLKESYPVQVAEFAKSTGIADEPAFVWWVDSTLNKRNKIISKVKSKYWQRTHKYGIKIPKSVLEAKKIDAENGDTLWWDAVCKEMQNVRIAFEECGDQALVGYEKISVHMIFDVKLGESYRRKARLVADGHRTETPASVTYSSVVSRDSVRIAFLIAALNDLEILACDIQNAYLTAPCREKYYIVAGPEFGSDQGKKMIVKRALYGLKSAGATFRSFLGEHLYDLGYRSSLADPDVWLRPAVKPDGFEYYEYVLCYVDDVLCISHNPTKTMDGIRRRFTLKDDKATEPEHYLGAVIGKITTASGTVAWTQSADKYIQESVKSVENVLATHGNKLPSKCLTPMKYGYQPEIDVTAELGREGHQYYQELIGILRWAVEIGRLDILLEVSLLSSFLASPREGHLEQVIHIFGYLKAHPKRKIAFDPDHPIVNERRFIKHDWEDFYHGATEAIPLNAPTERGNAVSMHCFVDANLAGNLVDRRSQTGILIFLNRAPILWHSKRQSTVATSTFGSEIVALKNAVELIEGLRYKLRMFGIPIDGPADIFCDNEAVTKNCSIPESTLKKKHHAIAYHRNREAVASGTVRIAKEDTETNLADLFTKLLPVGRRNDLIDKFMY